jgi:catechol 2,3-dioxygenase-like lactoylglutathione lyase family enzyme
LGDEQPLGRPGEGAFVGDRQEVVQLSKVHVSGIGVDYPVSRVYVFELWGSRGHIGGMAATSINHVSVHANDLDESVAFYEQLFGMRRIPTPNFGFPVQWLRLGDQQLHLFARPGVKAPRFHHIGLNVDDFEAVYWRAREQRLHDGRAFHSGMYELPDGAVQMYLRDPADNLIEIDWPDARTLDVRVRTDLVALSARVPQTGQALHATLYLDPPL